VDELKIIRLCKEGKQTAQRKLYDKYRSKWFVVCLRYHNHRQDALDALQNALIKIFSRLGDFNIELGTFGAWSTRIVVNECLMLLRKKKGGIFNVDGDRQDLVIATAPSVLDEMSAKEIVQLIQSLPDGYRVVFNLYAVEGYKHKEISAMLGISIGTSKSQLFKARKILQGRVANIFEMTYP